MKRGTSKHNPSLGYAKSRDVVILSKRRLKIDAEPRFKKAILNIVNNCLKFLETSAAKVPYLGLWYSKSFYGSVIKKEIEMASLNKRQRVLVVGCGPLPCTGFILAQEGYKVVCVDLDEGAIKSANKFIEDMDNSLEIELRNENGVDVDYSKFDAVWVTLHVDPKHEIINKILGEIREGGKVIFRNPCGYLASLYPLIQPSFMEIPYKKLKQNFSKESILLIKNIGG